MGFLGLIILGGLAGWVASMIANTNESMGVFANIIVGVIGAFIGGFVFNLFGAAGVTGFNIWSFIVALVGSVALLWVVKSVQGNAS